MNRYLAALAVVFAAVFACGGCENNVQSIQGNTGAVLAALSPSSVLAGGGDFTLTLSGANFVAQTVVQWNGVNLPTTFRSPFQVTAVVPAGNITTPGKVIINSLNPKYGAGDNGLSNSLAFFILSSGNPLPTLTSIAPATAPTTSNCSMTNTCPTLTLNGSNFLLSNDPSGGSVVHWSLGASQSSPKILTITAGTITATLTEAQLNTAGCASVTVFNPGPGGGTSLKQITFTVGGGVCPAASAGVVHEAPAVSSDGRYVSYVADAGGHAQVYVRDTCEGADSNCQPRTDLVSVAEDAMPGDADSHSPSISADGRYVAFSSAATNLLAGSSGIQVYLRDTCVGAASGCQPSTQLISTDASGALLGTENLLPSLSASGRFVAFLSVTPSRAPEAANVRTPSAPGVNSGLRQIFVRDTCLGAPAMCTPKTTRISQQPGDTPAEGGAPAGPALTGNSNKVAIAGNDATLLTRGVVMDDRFYLALTGAAR